MEKKGKLKKIQKAIDKQVTTNYSRVQELETLRSQLKQTATSQKVPELVTEKSISLTVSEPDLAFEYQAKVEEIVAKSEATPTPRGSERSVSGSAFLEDFDQGSTPSLQTLSSSSESTLCRTPKSQPALTDAQLKAIERKQQKIKKVDDGGCCTLF